MQHFHSLFVTLRLFIVPPPFCMGGVSLCPLGMLATSWTIVPALDDRSVYSIWGNENRQGNLSTWRNPVLSATLNYHSSVISWIFTTLLSHMGPSTGIYDDLHKLLCCIQYCDVFPVNTSNNLRVADFMLDLLVISLGGIYNWLLHSQSHCTTVHIQPSNPT
jgi:hypothetical protein